MATIPHRSHAAVIEESFPPVAWAACPVAAATPVLLTEDVDKACGEGIGAMRLQALCEYAVILSIQAASLCVAAMAFCGAFTTCQMLGEALAITSLVA